MADLTEFMQQAINLARLGRGQVEPNPMVGCVIVKDGRVIGQGYHQRFGQPHAEANALAACTTSPAGATAYITLEPCCHTGKKTPPCAPRLIEAGITSVVVACLDPNPAVSGGGVAQLRAAGIHIATGVLEKQAQQLNAAFFAAVAEHRPYVTLKWAQTADRKVAGPGGKPLQITGAAANSAVHRLRAACDAILVGIGTALADDPLLNARGVPAPRPLLRVVLDSHLRLPVSSQLVSTAEKWPLKVYTSQSYHSSEADAAFVSRGAEVGFIDQNSRGQLALSAVLADLHQQGVTHLLVEGGPMVAGSFIAAGLVDRVWMFRSPGYLACPDAPSAPWVGYPASGSWNVGEDLLIEMLNPASRVFFDLLPSADALNL